MTLQIGTGGSGGGIAASRNRSRTSDFYADVMAAPPALTLSAANAATGIATGTDYPTVVSSALSSKLTFVGKHDMTGSDVKAVSLGVGINGFAGQPGLTHIGFLTDAPLFELVMRGTGAGYRILIDGAPAHSGVRNDGGASNGSPFRDLVDFTSAGGSKWRRVEFIGSGNSAAPALRTVRVGALYSVVPMPLAGPKMVMAGDSYIAGSSIPQTEGGQGLSFGLHLGYLLGMPNCVPSGVPQRGHVNDVSGTRPTYIQNVADVTAEAPDLVIDWGSINDKTFAGVGAARTAYWQALKSALPNVVIVATSPYDYNGASSAQITSNVRDPTQAAAAAAGVPFVDLLGSLTGTGHIGATTGDGNRDRYIGTDFTHPFMDGSRYTAELLAPAVEAALKGTRLG